MFIFRYHASSSQAEMSGKIECSATKSSSNLTILAAKFYSFETFLVVAREYLSTRIVERDMLAGVDILIVWINDPLSFLSVV